MQFIQFTKDPVVKRLRWTMIAVMLFSVINTLAGQPGSFWLHPESAVRGDGLSIDNMTNHSFEFFLGSGWQPYLLANLIYFSLAFLLVSALPKRAALLAIFSLIFAGFFAGCNWLAVRWHMGLQGPMWYGAALATAIVYSIFPSLASETAGILGRLRWAAIGALLVDMTCTLLGQPPGYWRDPKLVHEANAVSRFFLGQGWYAYMLMIAVYCTGISWLVSVLPRRVALICIAYFILVFYIGASNWFYYVWRMGIESPVIYGICLSAVICWLVLSRRSENGPNAVIL
jgi:hypothetical protein